jgi:predicted Zn finger-like uncharacterized protein
VSGSKHNTNPKTRTRRIPMSLATRCTECKTIFRVMEDQLRVSEGWVRCGRCNSVFNGLAALLQLKRDPNRPARHSFSRSLSPEAEDSQLPSDSDSQPHTTIFPEPVASELQAWNDSYSSAWMTETAAAALDEPRYEGQQLTWGINADTAAAAEPEAQNEQHPDLRKAHPAGRIDDTETRHGEEITTTLEPSCVSPKAASTPEPASPPKNASKRHTFRANPVLAEDTPPPPHILLKKADSSAPARASFRQTLDLHEKKPEQTQAYKPPSPERTPREEKAPHEQRMTELPKAQNVAPEQPVPPQHQAVPSEPPQQGKSSAHKKRATRSSKARKRKSTPTPSAPIELESILDEPPIEETQPLAEAATQPLHEPSFVRRAQSQALWRSKHVRAALLASTVVLSGVLALQMLVHWRDAAATHWPGSRPWLSSVCALFSSDAAACEIQPPKRIANISLESSALVNGDAPNTYQLNITLRNRSTETVALPSIELNITNATNQLIARRALNPSHFRTETDHLPGSAEMALSLFFKSDIQAVNGYTVEAFYP